MTCPYRRASQSCLYVIGDAEKTLWESASPACWAGWWPAAPSCPTQSWPWCSSRSYPPCWTSSPQPISKVCISLSRYIYIYVYIVYGYGSVTCENKPLLCNSKGKKCCQSLNYAKQRVSSWLGSVKGRKDAWKLDKRKARETVAVCLLSARTLYSREGFAKC